MQIPRPDRRRYPWLAYTWDNNAQGRAEVEALLAEHLDRKLRRTRSVLAAVRDLLARGSLILHDYSVALARDRHHD